MKIFIAMPITELPQEQINAIWGRCTQKILAEFPDAQIMNTAILQEFTGTPSYVGINKLIELIKLVAEADIVYFPIEWQGSKVCFNLRNVANGYGKAVIDEVNE